MKERLIDAHDFWARLPRDREVTLADVTEALGDTPTIDAEPQWIPTSERLPDENGQYLITVKYAPVDGYDDIYTEHGEWTDGKWDMFMFGHCGEVESILAWMPLPEPYNDCGAKMDRQISEDKSHPFAESVMMRMDEVTE